MAGNLNSCNLFSDQETCNWFKASVALIITKQGLEKFVDSEIKNFQAVVGTGCGNCSIENVLHCPTGGICKPSPKCFFHKTKALQHRPCPSNACDQVQQNIASQHRYPTPSWKNTKAELWSTNHWEMAKCFLPPDGYIDVSSVQDTDFNGVISIMLNCKWFEQYFSFNISPSPPASACLLTKARQIGRDVRHTSNCQVTDLNLKKNIHKLTLLLSDQKYLANDPDAKVSKSKLICLQNNQPFIPTEELIELLKDAHKSLINLKKAEERLSHKEEKTLNEINIQMQQQAKAACEQVSRQAERAQNEIQAATEKSIARIKRKANEELELISKEAKRSLDQLHVLISTSGAMYDVDAAAYTQTRLGATQHENLTKQDFESRHLSRTETLKDHSNYKHECENFRRRLIQHYQDSLKHMPLSSFSMNESKPSRGIEKLFANRRIYKIQRHNGTDTLQPFVQRIEHEKNLEITCYKDLIYTNNKLNRQIVIQGEACVGKSSFTAKLVLDWCITYKSTSKTSERLTPKTYELLTDFTDIETLNSFAFVFFLPIRDLGADHIITNSIKKHIIDVIYIETERIKAYKLLNRILDTETCLILQDDIDGHREKQPEPERNPNHNQCTVLSTVRPCQLSKERIRGTKIDSLLLMDGIKDPFKLCNKYMQSLGKSEQYEEFKQYIQSNEIEEILSKPIFVTHVVQSWLDGTLSGGSVCELHATILDRLLKKAKNTPCSFDKPSVKCFEKTRHIQSNIERVNSLSELAFQLTFNEEKKSSFVFSASQLSGQCLDGDDIEFALKSGILIRINKSPMLLFAQRSFREFLAAYFIARNENVINDFIARYLKQFPDDILDISEIFIFLCGLNIQAANKLSCLLNEQPTADGCIQFHLMIVAGYREAMANHIDQNLIQLKLNYFQFGLDSETANYIRHRMCFYLHYFTLLKCVLQRNKSNVKSLEINDQHLTSNMHFRLTNKELQDILSSSQHCLEHLRIRFGKSTTEIDMYDVIALTDHINLKCIQIKCARKCDIARILRALPHSIENITLENVKIPKNVIRHFLTKQNQTGFITCTLNECSITSSVECSLDSSNEEQMDSALSNSKSEYMRDDIYNKVSLNSSEDSVQFYEALRGLNIKSLCVSKIENCEKLSELCQELNSLEILRIASYKFVNMLLPHTVRRLHYTFFTASDGELRAFLSKLSTYCHPLEVRLVFGYEKHTEEQFNVLKLALEERKFVGVVLYSFSFGDIDSLTEKDVDDEEISFFKYHYQLHHKKGIIQMKLHRLCSLGPLKKLTAKFKTKTKHD
ncbi:uncharacterized protein LOC127867759 [Dreissena polymorpha]|uniref:NACHT domain-containing protein n=1 Tax=Dreissena polymorpha TaxID=45954 RepID=A0A9D4M058_DREPO|nr:uncharacterized protein LOC127867759 [Dreissena polymorpha]XP_052265096.1 uncharacterized protein LOC127867759 [Dreissena polymorpha]XP_052265097.1 uncharacterized protein LOC127867759 [Dreissena polymorpha]XP_052265098.1 uncharacterized protein LOC127867759 [Dreissena polymorpha]KAH3868385.1 hypothetical protein DPMN_031530 [Dreissena polymorpha]